MTVYRPYGNTDYRYGNSSRLYGNPPSNDNLRWAIEVDWAEAGSFTGRNEATNAISLRTIRGRKFFLSLNAKGEADGFHKLPPGQAILTFNNSSGDYDGWNTSSPLYPDVEAGKDIRIRVKKGVAGSYEDVFYGVIEKIEPTYGDEPRVRMTCNGTLMSLAGIDARIALSENISKSDAVDSILDTVSWPARWGRNIESSSDDIPFWWSSDRALSEIRDLAESDLGVFFGDAAGRAVFYSRNHRDLSPLSLDQSQLLKYIDVPQPFDTVRNRVKILAHPREIQSSSVLWSLTVSTLIPPGGELDFWSPYSYDVQFVPAKNVIEPEPTTDYLANSNSTGTGSDLTGDFPVVGFTAFGDTAKTRIKNTGPVDGYVTFLNVRGQAITESYSTFAETFVGDGDRLFTLDLLQLQSVDLANNFSVFLADLLSKKVVWPRIIIEGRPDIQFGIDLFDTILLTLAKFDLTDERYQVGYIEHESTGENLELIRTTISLEPSRELLEDYWSFPAEIGVETRYAL